MFWTNVKHIENLKLLSVSLLAFAVVSGCGASGSGDSPQGAQTGLAIADGTWVRDCKKQDEDATGTYSKETLATLGASLTITSGTFSDAACTKEVDRFEIKGAFATSGNNVDFAFSKVTLKPATDAAVESSKKICADLTFKVGEATDIATCEIGKAVLKPIFQTFYASPTQLTLGKATEALDGSSAAKRPTVLDANEPYKKQ